MSFFYGNDNFRYVPFIAADGIDEPEPETINIKYYDDVYSEKGIKKVELIPLDISNKIHKEWMDYFINENILETINDKLFNIYHQGYKNGLDVYPLAEDAMSVFSTPISEIVCVVIGESPYPGWDTERNKPVANGKSFSTYSKKLPVSQEVIRISIIEHLKILTNKNKETPFDLQGWIDQGVFLLNHVPFLYMYKGPGKESIPSKIFEIPKSWIKITEQICRDISKIQKCEFILVGNNAKEIGRHVTKKFEVHHPSKMSSKSELFSIEIFLEVKNIKWNNL